MGIKFDKNPLAVEQNSYLTKIVMFILPTDYLIGQKLQLTISNLKIAYSEQLI